jgi:hypothetical protein
VECKITVDSGASIDEETFTRISETIPICLQKLFSRIFVYGSDKDLPLLRKFKTTIEAGSSRKSTTIHVVKGKYGSLMSYSTGTKLGVIEVKINKVANSIVDHLAQQYPKIFDGIGKLKDYQAKLHIDDSVQPIAQPACRIPFHTCKLNLRS